MRRWSTTWRMFNALDQEFDFGVDLCADLDNAKHKTFLLANEALNQDWTGMGTGFLNPPFGDGIELWLEKAYAESKRGARIVVIVPGRTNPPWWHDYVMRAGEIRFIRRKVSFDEPGGLKPGVPLYGIVVAIFEPFCGPQYPRVTSWDFPRNEREDAEFSTREQPRSTSDGG